MTISLVLAMLVGLPLPAHVGATPAPAVTGTGVEALYHELGLEGLLDRAVFEAGYVSMEKHGVRSRVLAIADMSQPSTAQRLFVLDLTGKKLVLRTWVAHGQNTGGLMAERFSNRDGSHQTSLGLYRVGSEIMSPKHGRSLLLQGLDKGLNDKALSRELIIHGADYVSAAFISAHGRLGRSWGCPAVPEEEMDRMIDLLADGGLLYVYGL